MRARKLLILGMGMTLAACGGDAGEPADTTFGADTASMDPAAQPGPGLDQSPAMFETAAIQDVQGGGLGGEVTIADRGGQAEVIVRLTGGTPDGSHPGHIHSGRCSSIGGVVQALEPISTDATGAGTMTATVDIPPMTVLNGQHIVVYHGAGGAPIACADIPQHTM